MKSRKVFSLFALASLMHGYAYAQLNAKPSVESVVRALEKAGYIVIVDNYNQDAFAEKVHPAASPDLNKYGAVAGLYQSTFYNITINKRTIILIPKAAKYHSPVLDKKINGLRVKDMPVAELITEINARAGVDIGLVPDTISSRKGRITLDLPSASILQVLALVAQQTNASQLTVSYVFDEHGKIGSDTLFIGF